MSSTYIPATGINTTYDYTEFPAQIDGRAGRFQLWHRADVRVIVEDSTARAHLRRTGRPVEVTWSPEIVMLTAHDRSAELAEQRSRPSVATGDVVRLGHLLVEVPADANEYSSKVCDVIDSAY